MDETTKFQQLNSNSLSTIKRLQNFLIRHEIFGDEWNELHNFEDTNVGVGNVKVSDYVIESKTCAKLIFHSRKYLFVVKQQNHYHPFDLNQICA